MKKILITGVYGFVGLSLYKKLSNKFDVYGVGTNNKNIVIKKKNKTKIITKAINLRILRENFSNIDYIIHCAGIGNVMERKISSASEIKMLKDILTFIKINKSKPKLIYVSSVSVYGNLYKRKIHEKFKTKPISQYAKTKLICEKICNNYSKKYKISIIVLRVSSLYGKGLRKQILFDTFSKVSKLNSKFYGNGYEVRDFLNISDFLNLIIKIINQSFNLFNLYNCGSNKSYKIKTVINKIIKIMKYNIRPLFNNYYINLNPKILKINSNRIQKKYNWKAKIKFDQGLKDYYNWFNKEYD